MRSIHEAAGGAPTEWPEILQVRARGGGCLVFVPSLHGRGEFAAAVRIAGGWDAVALEMDAGMADAFVALLRRHAPRPGDRLPGALAVARMRASRGIEAGQLEYVPLVGTDSMCEAARLAIAARRPVFGIDLAGRPPRVRPPEPDPAVLYPDSLGIADPASLGQFVSLVLADVGRQGEADGDFDARNQHMARRLLDLARRFRRLLVVIGLAHYGPIRQLLLEGRLAPLTARRAPRCEGGTRPVLLSPELAAQHMDRFPRLVDEYETARRLLSRLDAPLALDPAAAARAAIDEAYRVSDDTEHRKLAGRPLSLREIAAFEQLLASHSALASERVPGLGNFLSVARAAAERLAAPLLEALMRFPWNGPFDLPYPYLKPLPSSTRNSIRVMMGAREYQVPRADWLEQPGARFGPQERRSGIRWFVRRRTWPPEDRLATVAALRLAALRVLQEEESEEPLLYTDALSLLDGVDVRATLRNLARGEALPLAVRELRRDLERTREDPRREWPFPIVYVFSEERRPGGSWKSWYAPRSGRDGGRSGEHFHGIVGCGETSHLGRAQQTVWSVVAHFTPLVWGDPDEYRLCRGEYLWNAWLNAGHQEEMPVGGEEITSLFPALANGPTPAHDLVRLALRYCAGHVSVVLPDGSDLGPGLRDLARGAGRGITVFPASLLPADLLGRIRTAHLVDWDYEDETFWRGGRAAPGVEAAMGESQDAYREVDLGSFARPAIEAR
jgi:hypothetical protein